MKIVFFDINGYDKSYMQENFPQAIFLTTPLLEMTQLPKEIEDAQIISVFTSSCLGESILGKFKNLEMIALRSVGYSHIDLEYCKSQNIKVANTPHYGDNTVAEFAFGLLLSVVRKIKTANLDFENGNIQNRRYTGMELFKKTVGVIGTGSIGAQFIKIAKGFSMNVLGYDLYPNEALDIKYTSLDELCRNSDIISLHAPLTKDNCRLLNKEKFNIMKDGIIIINTARGELIDSLALYEALTSKKVLGAGLDVIESEEITAHEDDYISIINTIDKQALKDYMLTQKLLKVPNVIITPHIAYDTQEATKRILDLSTENINGFLNKTQAHYVI